MGCNVDLFEYQARDLFEAHQVPVVPAMVASTPAEARAAAAQIGGATAIKAQVKVGGRGKAGGVKIAADPEAAGAAATEILGMDIKGHTVRRVMVTQGVNIRREFYFSVLLDRANRSYLAICSLEGGVDIEHLAEDKPEALAYIEIDPLTGIDEAKACEIVAAAGFPAKVGPVLEKIYEVYRDEDATLVEVNPLVLTEEGEIIALDAKMTLDDNADFRHENRAALAEAAGDCDPLELAARKHDLNYVKLEGSVGIIGNGAGLVMSTIDVVANAGQRYGGQKPANFLDVGGGASAESMAAGLDIILGDAQVKSVLVNIFGGITACDVVAWGIVDALTELGDTATQPLIVRLSGNEVEEGRRILAEYHHPLVTVVQTMEEAAELAVAASRDNTGEQHVDLSR